MTEKPIESRDPAVETPECANGLCESEPKIAQNAAAELSPLSPAISAMVSQVSPPLSTDSTTNGLTSPVVLEPGSRLEHAVDLGAVALHAVGEPGTLPKVWCKVCEADVLPEGKGKCPRCKTFLKLNFVARKHPINKLRRDIIEAELVADYSPATTLLRASCRQLAGILEQLEVLKPGSPEWQRLVQTAQTLGASLHAAQPARETLTADGLSMMSNKEIIARLEALLKRVRECDTHTDNAPMSQRDYYDSSTETMYLGVDDAVVITPTAKPTPQREASFIAPCEFCHVSPCVGPQHPSFAILHHDDPKEIARRDAAATKVMLKQIKFGHPNY